MHSHGTESASLVCYVLSNKALFTRMHVGSVLYCILPTSEKGTSIYLKLTHFPVIALQCWIFSWSSEKCTPHSCGQPLHRVGVVYNVNSLVWLYFAHQWEGHINILKVNTFPSHSTAVLNIFLKLREVYPSQLWSALAQSGGCLQCK